MAALPPQNEFRRPPLPPPAFPPKGRPWGRIMLTACLVALPAVVAALFLTNSTRRYGYALFVVLPSAAGFICGLVVNAQTTWNWGNSLIAAALTSAAVVMGLLVLRVEGMVCILMAAALLWGLVMIGLLIAWVVRKIARSRAAQRNFILLAIGCVPLCSAVEVQVAPRLELIEQTSVIEIDAPVATVWRFVPAFPDITAPPSWIFRSGVAYPLRSEIEGSGVGASRRCVLSTGVMEETVTRWEPDAFLEFSVLTVPPAMKEASIYDHLETPHLQGYFTPQRGRFVLTPLPNGRTRLEGTSWYVHQIWPQSYWTPITRRIVHGIHERVLEHIKVLAEQEPRSGDSPPGQN